MRIQLHLPNAQRAIDAARQTVKPTWINALEHAIKHLPMLDLYLEDGALVVRSPKSGNEYRCTRTVCTCEAHTTWHTPCWHRALAGLVRWLFDDMQPVARCRHCGGPMVAKYSYGGEEIVECHCCKHVVMKACWGDLTPWTPAPTRPAPAAAPSPARPVRTAAPARNRLAEVQP